jgi:hypothetical protein
MPTFAGAALETLTVTGVADTPSPVTLAAT